MGLEGMKLSEAVILEKGILSSFEERQKTQSTSSETGPGVWTRIMISSRSSCRI